MWRLRSLRHLSTKSSSQFNVGDLVHGFRVKRIEDVPELSIKAYDLRHEGTGAHHLHLDRDDKNNCFSLTFRTTPKDSTGVAHILEHLVLCGSEKYPCRDPFMKMTQRSLATFLNAMTFPDATMYPFSSTNQKDFSNLMQVYLDAVFFPKLRYLDFIQEGWRLEHENVQDKGSKLCLKGVVFNEMKGAFSSSSQLYYRYLLNLLFPDTTYAHESGGDPCVIPELTYDQLVQFYQTHYHPTNARFLTYGSFPLENHLKLIDENVMKRFSQNPSAREVSKVQLQNRWTSSKKAEMECPPDPFAPFPDRQTTASVSFLLSELSDPSRSFEESIICHLLTSGPNSPFYKALISSGLGMDYSTGTGYMDFTKQSAFSVGACGMKSEDADKLEGIVTQVLESVAKEGFPDERVEAVLHQIEIGLKHTTPNFGLHLNYNIFPVLNHDSDCLAALHTDRIVKEFRQKIADKDYLRNRVRDYLLTNSHRLFLIMKPSEDFMEKVAAKEQAVLDAKVNQLSNDDKEKIVKQGLELKEFQTLKDDPSVLPTLNVETDISREMEITDLKHETIDQVPVQTLIQNTNGINYLKLHFDASDLPKELQQYLPLFTSVITRIGAGTRDHRQMDQEISLRTTGLRCSVNINDGLSSIHDYEKGVYMSSFCLEKNFDHMLHLWQDIICSPQFGLDLDHLSQLVRMQATDMSDGISHAGNAYAISSAAKNLTPASNFRETIQGLSFADFLKKQSESSDVTPLIEKLEQIQKHILSKNRLRTALTTEGSQLDHALKRMDGFLQKIPQIGQTGSTVSESKTGSDLVKEIHVMNFNTNYVGKAVTAVPFLHPDCAPLTIAGKIMTSKFLLKEVREIGGAYGVRAALGSGIFTFSSYRDPKTYETLEKFDESCKWLVDGKFEDNDISEAKLATFQTIDAPVTPESRGRRYFLNRVTDQQRHDFRMALLNVDRSQVVNAARKHLLERDPAGYAILSGPGAEAKEGWKLIHHSDSST